MKLIRLTSEDTTATFDCDFNGGITVAPYSKLSLQSVSANLQGGSFLVDSVNNKVFFEIAVNYKKEVDLTEFFYNEANALQLYTDITNKFNSAVTFSAGIGVNKILGLEWAALLGGAGKTSIQYLIGPSDSFSGQGGSGSPDLWDSNKVEFTNSGGLDVLSMVATETPKSGFTNMCILPQGMSRGCGFIRARIDTLTNTGATDTNGMIIAVSKQTPDPEDFEEKEIHFGIRLGLDNATSALYYALIIDGVEQARSATIPHIQAPASNRNDTLELMIDGNRINANIYNSQVLPTTKTTLGFVPYENDYVFPAFIFKGDKTRCKMNQIRFTPSQYYTSNSSFQHVLQSQSESQPVGAGVNAPPKPAYPIPTSANKLTFQSVELANYLGYGFKTSPLFGTQLAENANFVSENSYTVGLSINGFIIQLLNLTVESYDSLRNQRENILAVIPSTDGSGDLNYSPPFMMPIDLNNKTPLSLRNIKARIVRTDYTPFIMEGTGLINLLLIEKEN